MKRLFLLLVCLSLIFGFCSPVFAGRYDREDAVDVGYVSAKSMSATGAVSSAPGYIYGVTIYAHTASALVTLYDSTAASGNVLAEVAAVTQYTSTRVEFDRPIEVTTAIYATVTNGYVVVEYR
jgi:hypothetical protein